MVYSGPAPTPAEVTFTCVFNSPPTSVVDKYIYTVYKNGSALGTSTEVPGTTASVTAVVPVSNGDRVAFRVTPVNVAGKGATIDESILVDWLPAVPSEMSLVITH